MLMDDTQTRTTAASLFTAPMVSLNKGFVLLVWCSTELWRFATGLSTFVVKVSILRSTRLGPSHLSFEVKLVQGRDYITDWSFIFFNLWKLHAIDLLRNICFIVMDWHKSQLSFFYEAVESPLIFYHQYTFFLFFFLLAQIPENPDGDWINGVYTGCRFLKTINAITEKVSVWLI